MVGTPDARNLPTSCSLPAKTRIGAEESWQVEYVPGHFERWRHVRHTYACPACDAAGRGGQVVTAQRDPRTAPVEKGMLGPGLMACVVASKFAVRAITEGLRQEMNQIRVTLITPGVTESELGHDISVEDTAAAVG